MTEYSYIFLKLRDLRVYTLVYKSRLYPNCSVLDIEDILKCSTSKNKQHKITGGLYVCIPYIIQLLQGEQKSVEQLYENISRDKRHHSISVIMSENYPGALFPSWNMKHVILNENKPWAYSKFISIITRHHHEKLIPDLMRIDFQVS